MTNCVLIPIAPTPTSPAGYGTGVSLPMKRVSHVVLISSESLCRLTQRLAGKRITHCWAPAGYTRPASSSPRGSEEGYDSWLHGGEWTAVLVVLVSHAAPGSADLECVIPSMRTGPPVREGGGCPTNRGAGSHLNLVQVDLELATPARAALVGIGISPWRLPSCGITSSSKTSSSRAGSGFHNQS